MKKFSLALFLVIGTLAAGAPAALAQVIAAGSTVMIVQTPNDAPDLHYYIYANSDAGTAEVPFPISEKGDVFDMYVKGTAWDEKVYLLDTKVVNAYSPNGSLQIVSDDTWVVGDPTSGNYIKRTRADVPYSVRVTVSGLLSDAGAPQSATSLRLDRLGVNYDVDDDPKTYSALGAVPYTEATYSLAANGTTNTAMNNLLTPIGSTKACGEERWQLNRWADLNPDGTILVPETVLKNATVQIWPVSDVTLEGVTEGQEILDTIPSVSVQLKDVYPDSYTYCQVYKGAQALGTTGTKISGSDIFYGEYYTKEYNDANGVTGVYTDATVEPQNPDKFFIDLNSYCPTDGTYTLEVITKTPFYNREPERLKWITFIVNRKTAVRGIISSGN